MANGDPDLNLLVALRALLEEENVTHAGERIGLGQSTMSSALARLRAVFQDELLVRVGRDYELTPLARQILPQVQRTLPLVAQALGQEEVFDPATTRRRFSVHISDYACIELRPLFGLASTLAPGIRFDFLRLPTDPVTAERQLLQNDFLVLTPGVGVMMEGFEILRDEYVVVADRANPRVAAGEISPADFMASPLVRCDFGRAHTLPIERRMHELDMHPQVRVSTSTLMSVPLIVAGTDLIGLVPKRLAERSLASVDVVSVPTPFPAVELILRLWWHSAHTHDPAHTWFRELAAQAVADGMLTPAAGAPAVR